MRMPFSITVSLKAVTEGFEFAADLKMVINFAVEDDYGVAIFGKNRLIPGCQVNNLEARSTERAGSRLKYTLLIWSAMNKGICRIPYALWIWAPIFGCESNNATQVFMPLLGTPLWKPRHAEYWTRRTVCVENP